MELWAPPVIQIMRERGKLPCSALPPAPARTLAARLARARGRWPAGQRGSAGGPTRRASAPAAEQRRGWGRSWARAGRGGGARRAGRWRGVPGRDGAKRPRGWAVPRSGSQRGLGARGGAAHARARAARGGTGGCKRRLWHPRRCSAGGGARRGGERVRGGLGDLGEAHLAAESNGGRPGRRARREGRRLGVDDDGGRRRRPDSGRGMAQSRSGRGRGDGGQGGSGFLRVGA